MQVPNYSKLFNLEGKTALITGALGFLGKQFCYALAQYGANIVLVDNNNNNLKDFAKELSTIYGIKTLGIAGDISDPQEVRNMLEKTKKDIGPIHILHNNAATKTNDIKSFFETYENYSLETWNEVMSVNLNGMFLVSQAVGKSMIEDGIFGSIIQTSSIYGIMAPDQRIYDGSNYLGGKINTPAIYSASKAGVLGLTKYLASYWATSNIRVNCLTPGGVESGQNQTFINNYSERVPMNRMAKSSEMVGALIFLASEASSYVTGQNIIIDGGLNCW